MLSTLSVPFGGTNFKLKHLFSAEKVLKSTTESIEGLPMNIQVNLCFMYLDPSPCVTYLEKLLDEKPDERAENGAVFDRELYLREVEGFDDREVIN